MRAFWPGERCIILFPYLAAIVDSQNKRQTSYPSFRLIPTPYKTFFLSPQASLIAACPIKMRSKNALSEGYSRNSVGSTARASLPLMKDGCKLAFRVHPSYENCFLCCFYKEREKLPVENITKKTTN